MKNKKETSTLEVQKADETQKYDQLKLSGTTLEIYYKGELAEYVELEKMISDVFELEYEPDE